MRRILSLSKLRELGKIDYSYLVFILAHFIGLPIVMYYFSDLSLTLVILIEGIVLYLVIIFVYEIYRKFNNRNLRIWPQEYKIFLWLSLIFQVSLVLFLIGTLCITEEYALLTYILAFVLVVCLLTYLSILLIIFVLIMDGLYYLVLKRMFPYEQDFEPNRNTLSFFELSKRTSIPEQEKYLNTVIINLIVYFLAVIYVFLGIMSIIPTDEKVIKIIVDFSKEYSIASFGNTIGLISLVIAVYSTTYTIQGRIYNTALKKYNDEYALNNDKE